MWILIACKSRTQLSAFLEGQRWVVADVRRHGLDLSALPGVEPAVALAAAGCKILLIDVLMELSIQTAGIAHDVCAEDPVELNRSPQCMHCGIPSDTYSVFNVVPLAEILMGC